MLESLARWRGQRRGFDHDEGFTPLSLWPDRRRKRPRPRLSVWRRVRAGQGSLGGPIRDRFSPLVLDAAQKAMLFPAVADGASAILSDDQQARSAGDPISPALAATGASVSAIAAADKASVFFIAEPPPLRRPRDRRTFLFRARFVRNVNLKTTEGLYEGAASTSSPADHQSGGLARVEAA